MLMMMNYAVGFDESGRPVFSFFPGADDQKEAPTAVWQGRIHEVIPPFGTVIKKEITIEHHKQKTSDAGRNLRILKEMQRTEGLGTRDQYYYGKELYYHKQYREAERALAEFLKRPDGWREDQVDACRHRAYCLYGLSEEEEALSALLEGLRVLPFPARSFAAISAGGFLEKNGIRRRPGGTGGRWRTGKQPETKALSRRSCGDTSPASSFASAMTGWGNGGLPPGIMKWRTAFGPVPRSANKTGGIFGRPGQNRTSRI